MNEVQVGDESPTDPDGGGEDVLDSLRFEDLPSSRRSTIAQILGAGAGLTLITVAIAVVIGLVFVVILAGLVLATAVSSALHYL